jgi:peroxiredoxin Q/BCP
MKTIGTFIAGVAGLALLAINVNAEVQVGDPAPDFKLEGSDGKTYQLSDFKGKQAVVIAWFPKAFTGGCTAECKSLKENSEALKKYDVTYFTASVDPMGGEKGNKAFAESLSLDYPILSDPTSETAKAFGVVNDSRPFAQRWTYYIGKDGKVLFIDKSVKPGSHAQDMIAKFKELGIPERK